MFLLTIVAASVLRVYLIVRDSVPFAYDMARDLLWAKDIAFYHIPTLIGPAASIWGVYFGPFWFYLLSVPLRIFGGHPISAVYTTAAVNIVAGIGAFYLFQNYLKKTYALVLAIVILFSAAIINISTFAFHANILPLLTLLAIYFCFMATIRDPRFLALSFLAVSLMFHADPAPAVAFSFVPFFVFFLFRLYRSRKLIKISALSLVSYLVPFTPQILFEIRNNFIQSQALFAYFRGENPSLSGQLPPVERIFNRLSLYFDFLRASFVGDSFFGTILLLIIITVGIFYYLKSEKSRNLLVLFKINFISLIVTLLVFTVLVTVEIKNWYLYGLTIPLAFIIVFALLGFKKYKVVTFLFLVIYLVANINPFFSIDRLEKASSDPAQLSNQLTVVREIYADASGKQFSVYVYTPVIYDYPYQYIFWWQGVKLGKGLPVDFSYLPNQPSYVRNKHLYAKDTQERTPTVYLIIEKAQENEFYSSRSWLENFKDYKTIWQKDIDGAITLKKLTR